MSCRSNQHSRTTNYPFPSFLLRGNLLFRARDAHLLVALTRAFPPSPRPTVIHCFSLSRLCLASVSPVSPPRIYTLIREPMEPDKKSSCMHTMIAPRDTLQSFFLLLLSLLLEMRARAGREACFLGSFGRSSGSSIERQLVQNIRIFPSRAACCFSPASFEVT